MITTDTESDTFEAFRSGSEQAFERIFKLYYPRLCRFACKYTSDETDARDAVQTCFVRLWERRHTLAGGSLKSMLFTMLRNECLNSLKHQAIADRYMAMRTETAASEALYNADFLGQADQTLLYDELKACIDSTLCRMGQRTADIFRMSRFDGKKNREIAELLGISTTAVEKHIAKATKALTADLNRCYGPELATVLLAALIVTQ